MPFAAHPPEIRAEARRLYEEGEQTAGQIAQRLAVNETTVRRWAAKQGWTRFGQTQTAAASAEPQPVDRGGLVQRLYNIIDRNLNLLESRMSDLDPADPAQPDRDTRALGTIVRSLEKLKDLEPGHDSTAATAPKAGRAPTTPEEEDQLRMRIVERVLKLRERRGPDGRDR
jgi:transposase-like protein